MAAPLLTKNRVLAAKIEGTPGSAESLSASDATFNVWDYDDVSLDAPFVERPGQNSFSPRPGVAGARGARARFKTHIVGGASMPAWANAFLPSCGLGITSLVAAPYSAAPETASSKTRNITLAVYQGPAGPVRKMYGAMGNMVMRFRSGQPVEAEFEYSGVWSAQADGAIISPTYASTVGPRFADSGLVIGSVTPRVPEMTLDLGNDVTLIEDGVTGTPGYFAAVVTMRRPTLEIVAQFTKVADFDPFADYEAGTERAISWSIGSTGNAIAFAAPKAQLMQAPTVAARNGVQYATLRYQLNGSAAAGDDELTTTFS